MTKTGIGCIMVFVLALACAAQSDITVIDQLGHSVTLRQPVETLASVYGIGTYYIYALGCGDRLVTAYYVGLKTLSSVSESVFRWEPRIPELLSFGDPNVEELAASGAQLVLADGALHTDVAAQLRELGIPVVLCQVETVASLKEALLLLGSILGAEAEQQATSLIMDYNRIVDAVAADVAKIEEQDRVHVLFVGTSLTKAVGRDMYQSYLIEAAGGVSVTRDLPGSWNEVNLEQILLWDPDVIIIPPYGAIQPADVVNNPDWQTIAAVRTGRVHRMPRIIAPMDTPVPESLLGIAWMANVFYPEQMTLDLADEIVHFYTDYYQFALTDEEIGQLATP